MYIGLLRMNSSIVVFEREEIEKSVIQQKQPNRRYGNDLELIREGQVCKGDLIARDRLRQRSCFLSFICRDLSAKVSWNIANSSKSSPGGHLEK